MTPTYAACDGQELENVSARQYMCVVLILEGMKND